MTLSISVLDVRLLKMPVTATRSGAPLVITTDVVQVAIVPTGVQPVAGDWKVGSWETIGNVPYARQLVGPGTTFGALVAGVYDFWVKIFDSVETPAINTGPFIVN